VAEAYRQGVNYFDTAPKYCNCNSEEAVGRAVKGFRDKVLLSTKIPLDVCKKPGDYRRALEHSLDKLGTDHLDFYHFWGINRKEFDQTIMAQDLLADAAKAKEEGLIRHISFSFHDEPLAIKYIIEESKKRGIPMESMLVQYNLLDRTNEEMLHYAASNGVGTVAMGPVGGGRLAAPTELYAKLTGKKSIATYELAFKFVLGNPDLNCALSGMQTLDMVKQNAKLASDSTGFSKEELEQVCLPIVGMEHPFRYRNKAQFPVGLDKEGKLVTGFYAARTHAIIPVEDCLLGVEENKDVLMAVKEWMLLKQPV